MTLGRLSRSLFFLSAVTLTFVLQIRPLVLSSLDNTFHRQPPTALDVPYMKEHVRRASVEDPPVTQQRNRIGGNVVSIETANSTGIWGQATALPPNISTLGPIFYNIFVREKRERPTLQIIEEQVRFRNEADPESPISYTLIGSRKVDESIQNMCQPNCTKREYLKTGNEIDTLQALWEFCQADPSKIVTYLHDKGSFHPSGANRKSRGVGTKAALACRGLMLDHHTANNDRSAPNHTTVVNTTAQKKEAKSSCSICSYRFYTFPVYHARANMWTAHCSYIRKLISPRTYENAVLDMYSKTLNHTLLGNTTYACIRPYQQSTRFLGLERFAMERWALNHPDVEPCDSQTKENIRYLKREGKAASEFTPKLTPAPQKRAKTSGITRIVTSWERLEGRLFEWNYLYQKKPPKSSWVWRYYKGHEQGTKEFLTACKALKDESTRNMAMLNATVNGRPSEMME